MYTKLLTLEMLLNFRVKGERIFFCHSTDF